MGEITQGWSFTVSTTQREKDKGVEHLSKGMVLTMNNRLRANIHPKTTHC